MKKKYSTPKVYKSTMDRNHYKKYRETIKARSKQAYWDKEKKLGWLKEINYSLTNNRFCTNCSSILRSIYRD